MKKLLILINCLFWLMACGGAVEPPLESVQATELPTVRDDPNYVATRTAVIPTPFPQQEERPMTEDPISLAESDPMYDFVNEMKEDLAGRLNTAVSAIDLVTLEAVDWRDGSLGCPQPDMVYLQVITPGYRVQFTVNGKRYSYHTKDNSFFTYCEQDRGGSVPVGTPTE